MRRRLPSCSRARAWPARKGNDRVSGADGDARGDRTARADSLGVRGLGCRISSSTSRSARTRCWAPSIRDSVWRCGRCMAAGSRSQRRRWASAKPRSTKRSRTRRRARRSASRSPTTRRFSGCWRTCATELDAARMLTSRRPRHGCQGERPWPRHRWPSWPRRKPRTRPPIRRMQILASAGYRRGSRAERLFRDVRATEIYQGTSEAQRMIIASHVLANEPTRQLRIILRILRI